MTIPGIVKNSFPTANASPEQFVDSFPESVAYPRDENQYDPDHVVYMDDFMITDDGESGQDTSGDDHNRRLGRNDDCSANQQNPHDSG
jgi:hypothetical protein